MISELVKRPWAGIETKKASTVTGNIEIFGSRAFALNQSFPLDEPDILVDNFDIFDVVIHQVDQVHKLLQIHEHLENIGHGSIVEANVESWVSDVSNAKEDCANFCLVPSEIEVGDTKPRHKEEKHSVE